MNEYLLLRIASIDALRAEFDAMYLGFRNTLMSMSDSDGYDPIRRDKLLSQISRSYESMRSVSRALTALLEKQ